MKVCLIRPEDDNAAKIMSGWWDAMVPDVALPSALRDLRGPEATRESIEPHLPGVSLVLFFGHGTEVALIGGGDLIDRRNVALAAGSLIVAVACRSASWLGNWAASCGVRAYLGFSQDVLWPNPFEQEFGKAATEGAAAVLRGLPVREAARLVRDEFSSLVRFFQFGQGRTHPNAPIAFLAALWNHDYCAAMGDPDAFLL